MQLANFILFISRLMVGIPLALFLIISLLSLVLFKKLFGLACLLAPFKPGRYFAGLRFKYWFLRILRLALELLLS